MSKRKILVAIAFQSQSTQRAIIRTLESLGWDVEEFSWWDYISDPFWGQIQSKFLIGPVIGRINKALIERCRLLNPDVIFIHRGIYIWPRTIEIIRDYASLIVSWNTDDPFGNYDANFARRFTIRGNAFLNKLAYLQRVLHYRQLWSSFIKTIPLYDICFVIRKKNIGKYRQVGAKDVRLLRLFYVPEIHRPVELTGDEKAEWESQVTFVGHFEPDQRVECLEALLESGVELKLFGTGWNHYLSNRLKRSFGTIRPLWDNEYVKALCASKMALCFFSKLNNSTYTTRSFEIPACGTLLLSERTETVKKMFEENKEAVYFSDKDELTHKVHMLLKDPDRMNAIAAAGYRRCLTNGHDVASRFREWDETVRIELSTLR